MKFLDNFLDKTTIYRLMLYYLIILVGVAVVSSLFGLLPFSSLFLLFSTLFLVAVCWVTNTIFARVFRVSTNLESVYISALILALVITPINPLVNLTFLFLAGLFAMASKYILAINKKHILNPAAFAIFLTALAINRPASWWIGTAWMLPFVLIGGLLVARKLRRSNLVVSFLSIVFMVTLGFGVARGSDLSIIVRQIILTSPLLFFAFVMLTEPLTTPPTKKMQMIYGSLVGLLFTSQMWFASLFFTPELALLLGNIFSYIVSPKGKLVLKLKEKIQVAPDIFDFVFNSNGKLNFKPGQYLEWTLGHKNPDSRGVRRYFTIASSPLEEGIRLGVKFYDLGSSFKKKLKSLKLGDVMTASQLAGEFTLPMDPTKKMVFIAGGIGITPYRSMVKYLLDTNQKRDIVLFYSNRIPSEIFYKDVLDEARQRLGIKTVYTLTDTSQVPLGWEGKVGYVDGKMISEEVLDYGDRMFYLSGPHSMVIAFKKTLKVMGIKKGQIKIDFFPGFA